MVDPTGVIGVVGVVYDIAKDIYALHQRHQSDKRLLKTLDRFVNNTGGYVERLKDRQGLIGNDHIAALDTMSTAFGDARQRLVDLKTKLRGGWLDFGVYGVIREVDEDLKKVFDSCMPLATFQLVQSLQDQTCAIDHRLSRMEESAQVADSVQSDMAQEVRAIQESMARLSQKMAHIQSLLLAGLIAGQSQIPEAEQRILADVSVLLERNSVRLHEIDNRISVVAEGSNASSERNRDTVKPVNPQIVVHETLEPVPQQPRRRPRGESPGSHWEDTWRYSVIVDYNTMVGDLYRLSVSAPSTPANTRATVDLPDVSTDLIVPISGKSREHHRSASEGQPSHGRSIPKSSVEYALARRKEATDESLRLELSRSNLNAANLILDSWSDFNLLLYPRLHEDVFAIQRRDLTRVISLYTDICVDDNNRRYRQLTEPFLVGAGLIMVGLEGYALATTGDKKTSDLSPSLSSIIAVDRPYTPHPSIPKTLADLYIAWHSSSHFASESTCRMDLRRPCYHCPPEFRILLDLRALIKTSPPRSAQRYERIMLDLRKLEWKPPVGVLPWHCKTFWDLPWVVQILSCLSELIF